MYEENQEYIEEVLENSQDSAKPELDVEPVKFSKKKVWLILMCFLLIVMLILLVISQVSLTKRVGNKSKVSDTEKSDVSTDIEVSINEGESDSNLDENDPSYSESTSLTYRINFSGISPGSECKVVGCWYNPVLGVWLSGPAIVYNGVTPESMYMDYNLEVEFENGVFLTGLLDSNNKWVSGDSELKSLFVKDTEIVSTPEPVSIDTQVDTQVGNNSLNVSNFSNLDIISSEPIMGAEVSTSGMVTGKNMVKYENSYTYKVSIVLVTGNEENTECNYFCPRNTYSALSVGDAVNVVYQMDSVGNVSISSISK